MGRDSFVLYCNDGRQIEQLPDAEAGQLLKAIYRYVRDDEEPEGLPPVVSMAFSFIRSQLDRDGKKWEETKKKRKEAADKRWGNNPGANANARQSMQMDAKAYKSMQMDAVSVDVSVPVSVSVDEDVDVAVAVAEDEAVGEDTRGGGNDGNTDDELKPWLGNVFLTENQTADLLERMDLDTYDYYLQKLSRFIHDNDARVKNHYETILKWYEEDRQVRTLARRY